MKTRLSRSEYNKRGWTLQELTLSRRVLIFIDNRVFFRCQAASWDDTSSADEFRTLVEGDVNETRICGIPDPLQNIFSCLSAYLKLFGEYPRRELRYDGDALRAFYGLIRPLFAGMKIESAEGLPAHYINAFMLFTPPGSNLRRRHEFPSFSWAGWAGEIKWPRENLIWYGQDGQRTQSLFNIFRWLKRNKIAEWNEFTTPVDKGSLRHIRYSHNWNHEEDSHLVELLRKFPQFFNSGTVKVHKVHTSRKAPTGPGFPMPSWDEEISKGENPQ